MRCERKSKTLRGSAGKKKKWISVEPSGEGGHCCMLNSFFLLLTDITDIITKKTGLLHFNQLSFLSLYLLLVLSFLIYFLLFLILFLFTFMYMISSSCEHVRPVAGMGPNQPWVTPVLGRRFLSIDNADSSFLSLSRYTFFFSRHEFSYEIIQERKK